MQYYKTPVFIHEHPTLNRRQKDLFSILFGFLEHKEKCYYHNPSLAEKNQCSERIVRQDLDALEKSGLIQRQGSGRARNIYRGSILKQHLQPANPDQNDPLTPNPDQTDPLQNPDHMNPDQTQKVIHRPEPAETLHNSPQKLNPDHMIPPKNTNPDHMIHKPGSYDPEPGSYDPPNPDHMIPQNNKRNNKKNNNNNSAGGSVQNQTNPDHLGCSDPVVVFSSFVDSELLSLRSEHKLTNLPHLSNQDFLLMAKYHCNERVQKEGIEQGHAINGLKKIMQRQGFSQPAGYKDPNIAKRNEAINQQRLEAQKRASIAKFEEFKKKYNRH